MTKRHSICLECGIALSGERSTKAFCSTQHRLAFNNRRTKRGAEIYDLFRAIRRERREAKQLGLWTEMCRLELRWQEEDERERPGRRSYMPPQTALMNLKYTGRLMMGEIVAQGKKGNWSLSPSA